MKGIELQVSRAKDILEDFSRNTSEAFRNAHTRTAMILSALQVFGIGGFATSARAAGFRNPDQRTAIGILLDAQTQQMNKNFAALDRGPTSLGIYRIADNAGFGIDPFSNLVSSAWEARDTGQWNKMAYYLSEAWKGRVDANGIDRFNEGFYHALSFAQLMSCDVDAAYTTAKYSLSLYSNSSNPLEWLSCRIQMAQMATAKGDFALASGCLGAVQSHSDQLGVLQADFKGAWEAVTVKEFDMAYDFERSHFEKEFANGCVLAFLPRADLPYQRSTYRVIGAKSYEEQRKGEQVWLKVVPNGSDTFRVECHVRQDPVSFWEDIKALKEARPLSLPSTDPYLGESYGLVLNDRCKEIAVMLRGNTQYETIKNTMIWCDKNMPYTLDNSHTYIKNSDDALKYRKGVCNPRALACAALLRANGVPARVVRGFGSTDNPGWHTWLEIRSPRLGKNKQPIWIPTDVGSTLTNFPLHLSLQLYPSVAPFSEQGFEWETWYPFNMQSVRYSYRQSRLPVL